MAQAQDSVQVLARARRAVLDYDRAVHRYVVPWFGYRPAARCDEYVGGWCVIWDTGERSLPPVPKQVTAARDTLNAALADALPFLPAVRDSLLWRFADPLYLTPQNELLEEHRARLFITSVLRRDVPELLMRFGLPYVRTKYGDDFSDHWNPAERTYVPYDLAKTLASPARVDTVWPVDSIVRYTGHAPPAIRRMQALQHQAAVQLEPRRLVVHGWAASDSLVKPGHLQARLFVLDSALHVLSAAPARTVADADSIIFLGESPLPDGAMYYSAEVYDTASLYAARARFRIEPADHSGDVVMSGSLIDATRPVVARGSSFHLTATISGTRFGQPIDVEVQARGFTRKTKRQKSMAWRIDSAAGFTRIDFNMSLGDAPPGRYEITLRTRGSDGMWSLRAKRQLLVVNANRASSSSPL